MNKTIASCPACGSSNVARHEELKHQALPMKGDFEFIDVFYVCNSCGEEGDFTGESDVNYLKAKKDAGGFYK